MTPDVVDRGLIQEDLSELAPFLFVACPGARRVQDATLERGKYLVAPAAGDGYAWHAGFIFPLDAQTASDFASRFGVRIVGEGPIRRVEADVDFYERLAKSIPYAVALRRDDRLSVVATEPWPGWEGRAFKLERRLGPELRGGWSPIVSMLVLGDASRLPDRLTDLAKRYALLRPSVTLPRPSRVDQAIMRDLTVFRLRMGEYGWAYLDVACDDQIVCVRFSEVFDPFLDLAAWGNALAEGDLPLEMEIDEEGYSSFLRIARFDDSSRVAFSVDNVQGETRLLAFPDHIELASSLREELRRFFTAEFDPVAWLPSFEYEDEEPYFPVRELLLDHPFLVGD